jgi:hypothetical protein
MTSYTIEHTPETCPACGKRPTMFTNVNLAEGTTDHYCQRCWRARLHSPPMWRRLLAALGL